MINFVTRTMKRSNKLDKEFKSKSKLEVTYFDYNRKYHYKTSTQIAKVRWKDQKKEQDTIDNLRWVFFARVVKWGGTMQGS